MNIYLAGPFRRQNFLSAIRADLLAAGHTITSRWLDIPPEERLKFFASGGSRTDYCRLCAERDIADIRSADLVAFDFADSDPGDHHGREVEVGIALALGKPVLLVEDPLSSRPQNVFHHAPKTKSLGSWEEAVQLLTKTPPPGAGEEVPSEDDFCCICGARPPLPGSLFSLGWNAPAVWLCRNCAAPEERTGFMDKTDFDFELGNASGGNRVYPSEEDLREREPCRRECGAVEVSVRRVRVVREDCFNYEKEEGGIAA